MVVYNDIPSGVLVGLGVVALFGFGFWVYVMWGVITNGIERRIDRGIDCRIDELEERLKKSRKR